MNLVEEIPAIYPPANLTFLNERGEKFAAKRPNGVVVHYTADGDEQKNAITYMRERGLSYHLIIARDGTPYQCEYLDNRCNHAGRSYWNGDNPNAEYMAIALDSWGLLSTRRTSNGIIHESYTGAVIAKERTNYFNGVFWEAATPAQMRTLMQVLVWCCYDLDIAPQSICGHDECAIPQGRKVDPGGVLPMAMDDLRDLLAEQLLADAAEQS